MQHCGKCGNPQSVTSHGVVTDAEMRWIVEWLVDHFISVGNSCQDTTCDRTWIEFSDKQDETRLLKIADRVNAHEFMAFARELVQRTQCVITDEDGVTTTYISWTFPKERLKWFELQLYTSLGNSRDVPQHDDF